jgi:DNA-binding protein H-NS
MTKAARKQTSRSDARKRGAKGAGRSDAETVDLSGLDREALLQLQKDVAQALRTLEKRRRDEALREVQLVAERHGIDLREFVSAGRGRKAQRPKYRHPDDPMLTWTGRGRQPGGEPG